jgi:hypothetical protein
MKICTDCKHYVPPKAGKGGPIRAKCLSPNNASLVNGAPRYEPDHLRYRGGCLEGAWFELRAPQNEGGKK